MSQTKQHLALRCISWLVGINVLFFSIGALAANDPALTVLRQRLTKAFPRVAIESIKPSPVPGLFEVHSSSDVLYASGDARYILLGDLIDVAHNKHNLTEMARAAMRLHLLKTVSEDQMIVYRPRTTRHTITVFTDIDCAYCRRFHGEIPALLQQGIAVRYLFFPRAGIGSPSYKKAVAVWCSADRKKALTQAKRGIAIPYKNCKNPVAQELRLVQRLGLKGTPAIILENGQLIPGYVPAKQLIAQVEHAQQQPV